MKIAIVGNPGSGKSTLAVKLQKILGISLYHLDQYFWKPGWQRSDCEFLTYVWNFNRKHKPVIQALLSLNGLLLSNARSKAYTRIFSIT